VIDLVRIIIAPIISVIESELLRALAWVPDLAIRVVALTLPTTGDQGQLNIPI